MGTQFKNYMWLLNLVVVVLISLLLSRIATLVIANTFFPDVVVSPALPDSTVAAGLDKPALTGNPEAIIKRNFFDAKETVIPETPVCVGPECETAPEPVTETKPRNAGEAAVKTTLPIELRATAPVGDGRDPRSSCVVVEGRGQGQTYRVGQDKAFSGTKLVRVLSKRIEFLNDGVLEYAELVDFVTAAQTAPSATRLSALDRGGPQRVIREEQPEAAGDEEIKQDGNNFTIPRAVIDKALSNLAVIATEARAVPYWKEGKVSGFKMVNIKQGSIFEKLGIRRGDILKSINGKVLEMATGWQTFNELKDASSFTLEIERRGVPQTFSYQKI